MWDELLLTENKARKLAGNILMIELVLLQTKYMDPRGKKKDTVHRVPMDIIEDHTRAFFANYDQFGDVAHVLS